MPKPKRSKHDKAGPKGLTACEALALFDDLPDGAALAAAADAYGADYDVFIDALAMESEA